MARRKSEHSLSWLKGLLEAEGDGPRGRMPSAPTKIFDCEQIEVYSAGSPSKGRAILEAIIEYAPAMIDDACQAHGRGEANSVVERVHDLRGLAQVVGAYSAAQVCLRLELLYENSPAIGRQALIDNLVRALEPVVDSIRSYLDSWAA